MISIKLIKITIYQITIQKEEKNDDCYGFARIANNHQNCKNEKKQMKLKFHSLFAFMIEEKKRKKRLSNCQIHFHTSTINFHSFSFIQSISSKSIAVKITMRRGKENEYHQQPLNKFNTPLFNARVKRGQTNYSHPTTRFSNIL